MKPYLFIVIALLFIKSFAYASPGAHGPNGEHLDGPAGTHSDSNQGPRVETFTEQFELVGQLTQEELSILIDRYETNEPVLNGRLEVEVNGMKAIAKFHADHGDYAVSDPALLKALSIPGKHILLFMLTFGNDSDLFEGTLTVAASNEAAHHHSISRRTMIVLGTVSVMVLIAMMVFVKRLRSRRRSEEII
jgi:hypothetical protein